MSKDKANPIVKAAKVVAKHVNVKAAAKKVEEIIADLPEQDETEDTKGES